MLLLLLFLSIAVILYLIFGVQTGKGKHVLTVNIMLIDSGETEISFTPEEPISTDLIHLILCYGAKLRWLLNNEPEELREALKELTKEAIDVWSSKKRKRLIVQMPSAFKILAGMKGLPFAVPGGEQFIVHFQRNSKGSGHVVNDLPQPGMAVNLVWHYILLLDEVRARLDKSSNEIAKLALSEWHEIIFSDLGSDSTVKGLLRLNGAVNSAFDNILSFDNEK